GTGRTADGAWFHYLNDPIGTPERLVDEQGHIATEYQRRAWGELVAKPGAKASTPIRLQGQYRDEETGLSYNRWRYYGAGVRYCSSDPDGLHAGTYQYSFGPNALGFIDPYGLSVAQKLAAAMAEADRPLVPGQTAHHIVPREGGKETGDKLRQLLGRNNIGIDDAANGAALWGTQDSQLAQPDHPGFRNCAAYHGGKVHSQAAYKKVLDELQRAEERGGASAVRRQLGNIRGRMRGGRWNP
ncbi:MAG: RHS repeat-associated core domain-containing protein, partial [Myxococcota bacterium]